MKKLDFSKSMAVILSLLSILLTITNLRQTGTINQLNEINLKFTERQLESFSPFSPEIRVFPYGGKNKVFRVEDIAHVLRNNTEEILDSSSDRVELIFQNIGRLDSGPVQIFFNNSNFWIETKYIPNIPGESSTYNFSRIKYIKCLNGLNQKNCMYSAVPLGNHTLEYSLTCSYCTQPISIKTLNICVQKFSQDHCS